VGRKTVLKLLIEWGSGGLRLETTVGIAKEQKINKSWRRKKKKEEKSKGKKQTY
jgi:hypothetical protein